jgi:hypothetical protein
MKDINLKLNINEINELLKALGNMPYSQVATLIANIQAQASQQLGESSNGKSQAPEKEVAANK